MKNLLTTLSLISFSAPALPTIIEDFSNQPNLLVREFANPGSEPYAEVITGAMITGERDFAYLPIDSDLASRFFREISRMREGYGSAMKMYGWGVPPGNFVVRAEMVLQYDGIGDEHNLGIGGFLNNVGAHGLHLRGSDGGIRVLAQAHSGSVNLGVQLRQNGLIIGETFVETPEEFEPTYFHFPFAPDILESADSLSVVTRINLISNRAQGIDINRIDTIVPEPTTIAAFAGATVWMLVRKRRRAGEQTHCL